MRPLTRNTTERASDQPGSSSYFGPPKLKLDIIDSVADTIKSLVTNRDQTELKQPTDSDMTKAMMFTNRSQPATDARENTVLLTRQEEYRLVELLLKAMGLGHTQVDEVISYLGNYIETAAIPMLPLSAKRTYWRSAVALSKRVVFDIETVTSAIKVQTRIRGFLTRKKIQRLMSTYSDKSKMVARTNLVISLKCDEEEYGKKLAKLVGYSKMLQEKAIITQQDVLKIFSNVTVLWETHQIILLRLNQLLTTPLPDITGVGLLWGEVAPILNSYAEFLANSTHAVTTHQRLFSQNSKYKLFVNSIKGTSFIERLAAPCERISQYCQLIKDIKKSTPKLHPDRDSLSKAHNMMKNVEKFAKEHLSKANNRDLLLELQRQIVDDSKLLPGVLAASHRTYLDRFNVTLYKRSKERPVTMVVFNDMLVFVKPHSLHKEQLITQAVFVFEPNTAVADRDTKGVLGPPSKKKIFPIQVQNSESNIILFGCKDVTMQTSLLKLIQSQVGSLKIATSVVFGSPLTEMLSRSMPDVNLQFVCMPMSSIKHLSDASVFKSAQQKQQEATFPDMAETTEEQGEESELDFAALEKKVNDLSPKASLSSSRTHHNEPERQRSSSQPQETSPRDPSPRPSSPRGDKHESHSNKHIDREPTISKHSSSSSLEIRHSPKHPNRDKITGSVGSSSGSGKERSSGDSIDKSKRPQRSTAHTRILSDGSVPVLSVTKETKEKTSRDKEAHRDKSDSPHRDKDANPERETKTISDRPTQSHSKDRISISPGIRSSKSFENIKSQDKSPRGQHETNTEPKKDRPGPEHGSPVPTPKKYHTIDTITDDNSSKQKQDIIVSRRRGIASVVIANSPRGDRSCDTPSSPRGDPEEEAYQTKRREKKPSFNTDRIVPPFLVYLVEAIEESLTVKGLYRVSALEKDISELRSILIEAGGRGGKHVIKVFTPHTIADVFKLYFRELPEPLLTYDVYDDVINTLGAYDDDEASYAAKLRISFKKMPLCNFAIAKFLAKHLCRVAEHADSNLMNATNLAIVFGPSLLYPKERSMADALALPRVYSVVQCMIDHFSTVFGEAATRRPPWETNPRRKLRHSVSLKELPFQRSEMLAKDPARDNKDVEEKRRFTRVKMPSYHQDVKNLFGGPEF